MISYQYTLRGKVLKEVRTVNYLGVHMSYDLNWNHLIGKVTCKANRTLGFVRRKLRLKSRQLKERACFTLVRLQLEYRSSIWDRRSDVENNGSHKIEMVQRRAARWTTGSFDRRATVTGMFQELGRRSLEQRRVDSRLTLLFKIAYGLAPTCHSDQLRLPTKRSRKMHEHSFLPLPCQTTSRFLSFFPANYISVEQSTYSCIY